jgi:hypothetical protein
LKTPKGIRILTRYIWKDGSAAQREKARILIENFIRIKCEKYYIPDEGAFSYYPGEDHATLDGIGGFFFFKEIGAFSSEKQQKLWGSPEENIMDIGSIEIDNLTKKDIDLIAQTEHINSLRFYRSVPNYSNLTSDVFAILYPRKTYILDIMDLTQKIKLWIETTTQTMGNWVSKADIYNQLKNVQIEEVPIYEEGIPFDHAHEIMQKNNELVVLGFDVMQIPRSKIIYKYSSNER